MILRMYCMLGRQCCMYNVYRVGMDTVESLSWSERKGEQRREKTPNSDDDLDIRSQVTITVSQI